MNHPTWRKELRALLRLSLPVVTVQVGMMLMGFVDSMMVGHYSESALAACALGNFYSQILLLWGLGVLLAFDPVMSQAVGAGDEAAVTRNLQRGIVLSVGMSIPVGASFCAAGPVLGMCNQEPALVDLATTYIWILIPSVLPFYGFQMWRTTLQAHHRTAPIVWTIVLANALNVLLNWVFIYGRFGVTEMGLEGSAYATLIARWAMFICLLVMGRRQLWCHLTSWTRRAFESAAIARIVRVGAPIGMQIVFEFGAFGMTLLMMGWISKSALAGHQAAITLASMTYMFGLGISVATGVRVGNAVGRGDSLAARWSAGMGLIAGALIMAAFAVIFLLVPGPLASMFSKAEDVGVREVTLALLPVAAVFQVMDGVQVISLGALRGVGDTKVPMVINLVGFWLIGLPVGYYLAFHGNTGPAGLWWGLTVGLTVVAVLFVLRMSSKLRGDLARTVIDESDGVDSA
ncbi:MAG: MATE family efflux transporter [Planctomycetota bacterium]|nr:MATE family efflux transporter [Planctomycetota bacterium]